MTPYQAEQLRRAIRKSIIANLDCAYADSHEPQRIDIAEAYKDKCARRLEMLIRKLTVKPVPVPMCSTGNIEPTTVKQT